MGTYRKWHLIFKLPAKTGSPPTIADPTRGGTTFQQDTQTMNQKCILSKPLAEMKSVCLRITECSPGIGYRKVVMAVRQDYSASALRGLPEDVLVWFRPFVCG